MEKPGFVYRILAGDGNEYIGSSHRSKGQRMAEHKCNMETSQLLVYKHLRLFGWVSFDVLEKLGPCTVVQLRQAEERHRVSRNAMMNSVACYRSTKPVKHRPVVALKTVDCECGMQVLLGNLYKHNRSKQHRCAMIADA